MHASTRLASALTHVWPLRRQRHEDGAFIIANAPHAPDARSSEAQRQRVLVIQSLYREHAVETGAATGDLLYAQRLPPAWWVNDKLEARGESWRIQNIDGFRCEVFELS
jgi:hypothetical protein